MPLETLSDVDSNTIERALNHAERVRADTLTVRTEHLRALVDAAKLAGGGRVDADEYFGKPLAQITAAVAE